MCQVDEDYLCELDRAEVPSVFKKCVKCKEASAAVVIRAGDTYCRGCFKEYFIHKFRAMLGKNRIIFPGDKVLLAVSGGSSSCSMLSQVQEDRIGKLEPIPACLWTVRGRRNTLADIGEHAQKDPCWIRNPLAGLSQNAHKKLRFIPGIVYIDEGGVVGQSVDERQRTAAELKAVFRATGFPFYVVPLEQVLDLPSSVIVTAQSSSSSQQQPASAYKVAVDQFLKSNSGSCLNPKDQEPTSPPVVPVAHTQFLQQLIVSAKTLTARHDLLNTLRQHLLVHTARTEGYRKVMLGDNCTRLAIKLLTSISLGRGAQLAQDTGFSDSRYGDIILVRPMRDYSAKEIAYYNHFFNVASVFIPSLDTKTTEKASIQRLTESFVTKLQVDFPSTVSTIYRTSEKLQTTCKNSSTADLSDRCLLCVCALDTSLENASSYQATLTSEQLSQTKYPARTRSDRLNPAPVELESSDPSGQCCSSGGGEDCGRAESGEGCCSAKEREETNLKTLLCYSCHLTIKDMSSVEHLPQYILLEAQRRERRSKMREEISEFLLDDGEGGN